MESFLSRIAPHLLFTFLTRIAVNSFPGSSRWNQPRYRDFNKLDPDASYHVEVIDTWNMTIDDRGIMKGRFHLDLPGKEFTAIRVVKVKGK